jgi:hypothetical protein
VFRGKAREKIAPHMFGAQYCFSLVYRGNLRKDSNPWDSGKGCLIRVLRDSAFRISNHAVNASLAFFSTYKKFDARTIAEFCQNDRRRIAVPMKYTVKVYV